MLNKEDILVIINNEQVIISFEGCKLIKPINNFENLNEEEIKNWFIKEVLQIEEVT